MTENRIDRPLVLRRDCELPLKDFTVNSRTPVMISNFQGFLKEVVLKSSFVNRGFF
jgi:hypothetical protein